MLSAERWDMQDTMFGETHLYKKVEEQTGKPPGSHGPLNNYSSYARRPQQMQFATETHAIFQPVTVGQNLMLVVGCPKTF